MFRCQARDGSRGRKRIQTIGVEVSPFVGIAAAQTAGNSGSGGTVVGTVAPLRFRRNGHLQRLGDDELQRIGEGTAVLNGGEQDGLAGLIGETVTVVACLPRVGFAAGGVFHRYGTRVVNQQIDMFLFNATGGHQYRMTAVVEGDVRNIVHIDGIIVATPVHAAVVGIDSEVVLHVENFLTGGEEDGGGGEDGGVEQFHALDARIGAVGIDPVVGTEHTLQSVAGHLQSAGGNRLVAVVLEGGEHAAHLVVVGHRGNVGSGAVASDTAHILAVGRHLARAVAVAEVAASVANHATHIVGEACGGNISGIISIGKGTAVATHHTTEEGGTVNVAHVEAVGY